MKTGAVPSEFTMQAWRILAQNYWVLGHYYSDMEILTARERERERELLKAPAVHYKTGRSGKLHLKHTVQHQQPASS